MMKKHLWYLLTALVTLALVMSVVGCGKSTQVTVPKVEKEAVTADSSLTLVFDQPMTVSEIAQFSSQHNLKVLELQIKRPMYVAGFRLDGRDLTTAGAIFASEHRKFLNLMLSQKTPEMSSMRSAAMTELATLNATTIKAQAVTVEATPATVRNLPMVRMTEQSLTPDNPGPPVDPTSLRRRVEPNSVNHPNLMWAPYGGTSIVNKSYSYQTFIFNDVSKLGSGMAAYEHQALVWDKNFANQTGYWSSNLPYPYLDCGNGGDSVDNFAVGSFKANQIRTYTSYYTYIGLYGQSAVSSRLQIWAQRGTNWTWSCVYVISNEQAGPLADHTTWGGVSWQF